MLSIVIGASSGIGKEIAYELAKLGSDLIICATDIRTLHVVKSELETLYLITVKVIPIDLTDDNIDDFLNPHFELLSKANYVFITSGKSIDNDSIGFSRIDEVIKVNLIGIMKVLENILKISFELKSISVISSVATIRPRKNNIYYGSTKSALEHYLGCVRHYLVENDVGVNIYRAGYVDTGLSYDKKLIFPMISPITFANYIIHNKDKNKGLITYPKYWLILSFILKLIPWFIYKKLNL